MINFFNLILYILNYLFILNQPIHAQYLYDNNCSDNNIKYDKVIGIRPIETTNYILIHKNSTNNGITTKCLTQCSMNSHCSNVIVLYNVSECYQYKLTNTKRDLFYMRYELNNIKYVNDPNAAFFLKTCFNVSLTCASKLWPNERVPGSILITNANKVLSGLYTRQQCAQKCLSEDEFQCRSANFHIRGRSINIKTVNITETLGGCSLNADDRHTLPNSFRISTFDNEYIENQCVNVSTKNNYCSYEEYINYYLSQTDEEYLTETQDKCRQFCENSFLFNCHGYSVIPINNQFNCRLHSEDTLLLGPRSLIQHPNSHYFERARCLNMSVSCTNTHIYIKYTPENNFYGRIYMSGYSDEKRCGISGNGNTSIILRIEIQTPQCGITEALALGQQNRTLLSGYLIIQYNPLIQTQGDRLVKVGCLLDDDLNNLTKNVTVGADIQFNSSVPGQGSIVINNSTIKPIVTMLIVDPFTNMVVTDVQIGQEIQLRIEIEPAEGPYDIWASNLITTTENNSELLPLIDDVGCPTRLNLFPPLTKIRTDNKRILYSNFFAFKFPSSAVVKFSVLVHFCTLSCPQINCISKRLKRENYHTWPSSSHTDIIQLGPISNNSNIHNDDHNSTMMSLEYVIIVRFDNISSDRLIFSDGKVIIAGYDVSSNEVCINYFLLLGLLVLWLVIQLIILIGCILTIQKYKKYYDIAYDRQSLNDIHHNFGFGYGNMNRRVHWADNCPQCPHSVIE